MSRAALPARLAVAAALLALLWTALAGGEALARLRGLHPGWALAALAALSLQTVLAALRWRLTAARLGIGLGRRRALGEYYLAQLVNQTLPGGMLGDVGRALRNAGGGGMLRAGQAVMLERLMGNAVLLAVLLGAVAAALTLSGQPPLPGWLLQALLACLGAVALAAALVGLPRGGDGRLARLAGSLREALRAGLLARGVLGRQILLSLGTVAANLAGFAFAARATGTALPLLAALVMLPMILFAMLIPLSISGWGLREGAAAALFPMAGFSPGAGLAASIAFGLIFLLASLPGLVVLLRRPAPGRDGGGAGNASQPQEVEEPGPPADCPRIRLIKEMTR